MISFYNNTGAATALQMLGGTNQQLNTVQNNIATGQVINTAQDNAALWAVTELMQADVAGFQGLSDSLALGEATLSVASAGAEFISDTLSEMKQLALLGSNGAVDFSKIEAQLAHKTDQINSVISSSQFNGANLLKSDIDGNGNSTLTVASSLDRSGSNPSTLSNISVDSVDFENSASFDIDNRTTVTDAASAQAAVAEIEGFIQFAVEGAARLGASASRISDQQVALSKHADATKQGISALRDTNLEEAAVLLKAQQVQQQLGYTALSIANQAPQNLSALYGS